MKILVVLSLQPSFAEAVRSLVSVEDWKVIHHQNPTDAGLLAIPGAVDVVVVECCLTNVAPIQKLELLQKKQPGVPLILLTDEAQQEWIEEAYLAGATMILPKPLRQKLFQLMLDRAMSARDVADNAATSRATQFPPNNEPVRESPQGVSQTLATLRDLSRVLTHGLVSDALPKRFLELLREVLGVNRAAIFLRDPFSAVRSSSRGSQDSYDSLESLKPHLQAACAVGVDNNLLDYFNLSLEGGIGRQLHRSGRILRIDHAEVRGDREIQKEFELLGMRVAIPILDRGKLLGVAVFDDRLTGEPFTNSELALVFHALEELGLAVKNSWLHDEVSRHYDLLNEILGELTSGCVVVSQDLQVIHCNPAARRFLLGTAAEEKENVHFSDLPQTLGSRIFESIKTGAAIAAFRHRPREMPEIAYHVSIIPFHHKHGANPTAALMLIDDFTQFEHSQQLEIEASNLRMVRSMAEHLSHEIGNALVPMSTHQQLLGEKYDDPEFRGSLSVALTQGIKRISRLSNQLLFLTRDDTPRYESFAALKLIEDAFSDAQTLYGMAGRHLEITNTAGSLTFDGNRASLLHALSEAFLNALQSSPPDSSVAIQMETQKEAETTYAKVQIVDKGPGFTPDLASKAANPFFSTRTVGPGLGLTVAKKIIENHHGRINLITGEAKGKVAIYLPIKNGNGTLNLSRTPTVNVVFDSNKN